MPASATLTSVLIVFGIAIVLVIPSLALLYTLAQRDLIAEGAAPLSEQEERQVAAHRAEDAPAAP